MATVLQHTFGRWRLFGAGSALLLVSLGLFVSILAAQDAVILALADTLWLVFGWGSILEVLSSLGQLASRQALVQELQLSGATAMDTSSLLRGGLALAAWTGGWLLVARGIRHASTSIEDSPAVGAPLFPKLAHARAFDASTLLLYGGGILLSEVLLTLLYTALSSGEGTGASSQGPAPVRAFALSLLVGAAVSYVGGFLGAARARRLAIPEASIALLYFGLPLPLFLSLVNSNAALSLRYGEALREVNYLAGLLGRPDLGFALVYLGLLLMLFLGITSGFVATGSGRIDVRTGFEWFVASRHVSVFRPRLLLSTLAVLLLGIVPPLILYAILQAARTAVEKARIRQVGVSDPLLATSALHAMKQKAQSPTAMMTALSVGGVGVGVMALIIVLSVMSGFEIDLQKKILGTNAHGVVLKYSDSMPEYEEVMTKVRDVPGVRGATPFIHGEVMVSSEGNISGALIKGIDPQTVGDVTDLPENILPGGTLRSLEAPGEIPQRLAPRGEPALDEKTGSSLAEDDFILTPSKQAPGEKEKPLPAILVGKELAAQLRVLVGDRLNVVSPLGGELGPSGPMPKSRPFRVGGIFYTGMFEYDSKMVYIHLKEAQAFFNLDGASGVELKVTPVDDARRITRRVYEALDGYPYRTKDWGEMNRNLFSALRLEKLVMAIILSIIVIVAAGLIVATVIMLVLEKRKEIAVLKALGVPDGGIVKIFLLEGLQIGVAGGLLGLFSGLAWCLFIEKVGIQLDPEVYYIPSLPVRIEPVQTALSVVIAVLVTFLASIYPALKASQVEPVEGLKAE